MKKVFVSSKQGELDPERAALHNALQSAEWDNFAIEFSGAFPDSVREVFLKHVAECDVYLGIFASIYSQPTVDEYHKAKELGKPILIYLKKCATREQSLQDFIRAELQPSHKYQEFSTAEELVSHLPDIRRALDAEIQKQKRQAYLDALVAQTELLELAGIVDSDNQTQTKLQDIYIALSAAEEVEERDERQPKRERERERPIKITRRVTIEQALREHRNLMILGDPGAGKSTLLRYLTLVSALSLRATEGSEAISTDELGIASSQKPLLAMTHRVLPILIRLSGFAQSKQSFIEYFESCAKTQLNVSLGEKLFERALEDGTALVCLDGLDEVSQPAQRFDVRNAITALANHYPRNRFIVTSRVAGYDSASLDKRTFAHHTIAPFGEKEIQSFVEKWYAAREPEQAKTRAANLFNDLKANERLLKLAENPLTLTIIALVHQRADGKLPTARVELYDRCVKTMIDKWDEWKGLEPKDKPQPFYTRRRHWLERAAFWMHIEAKEQDVAQVSKRALEKQIAEFLIEDEKDMPEDVARDQAEKFIALTTSRTGILVEREPGSVSFIHLTFQEYFAASDLYWRYRRTPDALWQAIQPHLYGSRWLEVILLLLGRLNDEGDTPSIIVEKILRAHDKFDDVIHRDLFLAARCLADGVKLLEQLRNEIVNALIRFANEKRRRYDPLRYDSIQALGTLRGNMHISECLLRLAKDENVELSIQILAAEALRQLGYTEDAVIQALLALALDTKVDDWLQEDATRAGGKIGRTDEAMFRSLRWLIQDEKTVYMRTLAAQALGQLGHVDDTVIQELVALVRDGKMDAGVRRDAALVLGQLERADDLVIQGLLALAQDEKIDEWFRRAAPIALGQLGRTDHSVIPILLSLAQDSKVNSWLRGDAVRALGKLGDTDDKVIPNLLALIQNEKLENYVQVLAAQALGILGHTNDVVQLLLTLVQNTEAEEYVRIEAIRVLGQLGHIDGTVIQGLLALAQGKKVDMRVQSEAAQALGQLGRTDDAVRLLLAMAQDKKVEGFVRTTAAQALGQLGKKEPYVALALLRLASDKNDNVRNAAYDALKEVTGNLRYAELDNGQKRIKRTGKRAVGSKQKAVSRKRKKEIPRSTRNDKAKNRKSKILNPNS